MQRAFFILLVTLLFILLKNYTKENFITYYLPFYRDPNKNVPSIYRINKDFYNLKFKYKGELNVFYKDSSIKKKTFYSTFLLFVFRNINANNLYIKNVDSYMKLKTVPNSIYFISSLLGSELSNTKYKDLTFIGNINYKYVYILTKKYKDSSEIPSNAIIGVGNEEDDSYIFGKQLFLSMDGNVGNNTFTQKFISMSVHQRFRELLDNKLDAIIITDFFPSNIINFYLERDFERQLIILPFTNINNEVLLQKLNFVSEAYIDLNLTTKSYLPKTLDKIYDVNKPDMQTYKYPLSIYGSKDLNPQIGYEIPSSLFNNLDLFNEQPEYRLNKLAPIDIALNMFERPLNEGSKKFYNERNFYTTFDDPICKYYLGKIKCTPENVQRAKVSLNYY